MGPTIRQQRPDNICGVPHREIERPDYGRDETDMREAFFYNEVITAKRKAGRSTDILNAERHDKHNPGKGQRIDPTQRQDGMTKHYGYGNRR